MTTLRPIMPGKTWWLTALLLAATAAEAQPDLTGAWTVHRDTPNRRGIAAPNPTLKLTPAARAAQADYRSLIDGTNYAPGNACVGYGMPESALASGVYPMEIIQRPEQVFVIYELHNEMRRLLIGDAAQDPANFFPECNGYSTAHWEGDRLIVETTRLKTQVDTRYPHSSEASIREVYYLDEPLDDGTRVLTLELTMHDPRWLEEPFVTTKRWEELKDYHVLTYECSEPRWLDEECTMNHHRSDEAFDSWLADELQSRQPDIASVTAS